MAGKLRALVALLWVIIKPFGKAIFKKSKMKAWLRVLLCCQKKGILQDIRNWRSVSLLCTDSTILSKALAKRLREVIDQVVHRDQTYCVPGRSIVDNVSLIHNVLGVSGSLGLSTGLISIDQEKAFD